jgi:hypothetical protein
MGDRDSKPLVKHAGAIVRPSRSRVFSDLLTPGGGSVKVMSREVYAKASRAAGAELKKAAREGSVATSEIIAGRPSKGLR